ncbi:hypothetical protein [Priestia endophytica]|uniref:hypothetical protein n=1 Tax=Priestia endophytica TaxID=135735 RepID=UPI000DCA824C|nr:hypothetical protein [Priestia endophytica]RAS72783.1 hypothetical protein A4R27_25670 [Priestia endophytica]
MKKKIVKGSLVLLSSAIVFTGIAPGMTSAATNSPNSVSQSQYPSVGQLTPQEVEMFLNNGATYTDRSQKPGQVYPQNIVTSLAKKLAVQALRKSGTYVEGPLSKVIGKKYAAKAKNSFYKIADYIEKVQNVQESAIASILIKGGLPPDIAIQTAHWLVLFFGL